MAVFSAFKTSWTQDQSGLFSSSQLVLPYTEEEESWLVQQFRLLDEAHSSVSLGEDTTREFMMYSLDVPVSKTYMKGKLIHLIDSGCDLSRYDVLNENFVN